MSTCSDLTTAKIFIQFMEEVTAHGGRVRELYDDETWLFARALLPRDESVRPDDGVKCGVAVRASDQQVWLCPYLLRMICRNGAIFAQSLGARHLDKWRTRRTDEVVEWLHQAVASCCAKDVFVSPVHHIRIAGQTAIDNAVMDLVSQRFPLNDYHILGNLVREGDRSRFGLVNAVTSTARDTQDPKLRWDLEEFGGEIAMGKPHDPRPDRGLSAARQHSEPVSVG